jgi:NADH:ubiquinone reductase (H+-translocating)
VPRLRVTLLAAGDIAAGVSVRARRAIVRRLEKLGVDVEAGSAVTRIIDGGVVTADGRIRSSAATVVCCSFGVPELATRSGLPVDDAGRLLVDETLTALGRPDIVGVGDAIALPPEIGWYNRMSCQSASPLGAHGGGTVLAGLEGAAAEPVSFGFVGTNISLGRRSGVIQFAHLDDSPSSMILRGRSAATVKELVCRATLWGMKIQGRMKRPPLAMPAPRRRKDLVTA